MNAKVSGSTSLRGFARLRSVSPSWIHKLCTQGTLQRDAAGKINVAEATRVLDGLRTVANRGRLAANAARKQRLREAAHEAIRRPEALAVPLLDVELADDMDTQIIDVVMADACLDAQPGWQTERVPSGAIETMLQGWDDRMGAAQAKIVGAVIDQTVSAIGPAGNSVVVRKIMGTLFGSLRQLITDQRLILEHEVVALLAASREGNP